MSTLQRERFRGIGGIDVQYAITCKRELWFYIHHMNVEREILRIGKALEKVIMEEEEIEELMFEDIAVDGIKRDKDGILVVEIKKSKRSERQAYWQLLYYLYYILIKTGKRAKGRIIYGNRESLEVTLDDKKITYIERIMKAIEDVKRMPKPPPPQKKPFCKKCAYYDLCWV